MGPFPERKVGKKRFVLVIVDMLTRRGRGMGNNRSRRGRYRVGIEEVDSNTGNTLHLVF